MVKLKSRNIDKIREALADAHVSHSYYDNAESENWLAPFWSDNSPFLHLVHKLNLEKTMDFACGHGRHSNQIKSVAKSILLVDVNKTNIDFCRERFAKNDIFTYLVCNGRDLREVKNNSLLSIFSFDAMVHFECYDVIQYLSEFYRVLMPGGRALVHHSIYDKNPEGDYSANPSWRNYFSESLMTHFCNRIGFRTLEKCSFTWPPNGEGEKIDGLILLEK